MGKNEIRIRRQRLTARGADRFRNYDAILKRHEDEKRLKKVVRVFTLFLIILIIILLIIIVTRWEEKQQNKNIPTSESVEKKL